MVKVFVDGQEGTTGLQIVKRLSGRKDISLISIPDDLRKDASQRKSRISDADIVLLCLPDEAARESVSLAEGMNVRILDASTAHRTAEGWAYGFPELSNAHREAVEKGSRVSVPGCHASGFAALVYPLVAAGLLPPAYPIACHSVTGYSGGGKKMIAAYEGRGRPVSYAAPRQYALSQQHKHLPEMQKVCGLAYPPVFCPIVSDFYSGMVVTVPLHLPLLQGSPSLSQVHEVLSAHYQGQKLVKVLPLGADQEMQGFMSANELSGLDTMEILVAGNDQRAIVSSRFDNLGKGASGAAVQCLNLMLGMEETLGLSIE